MYKYRFARKKEGRGLWWIFLLLWSAVCLFVRSFRVENLFFMMFWSFSSSPSHQSFYRRESVLHEQARKRKWVCVKGNANGNKKKIFHTYLFFESLLGVKKCVVVWWLVGDEKKLHAGIPYLRVPTVLVSIRVLATVCEEKNYCPKWPGGRRLWYLLLQYIQM